MWSTSQICQLYIQIISKTWPLLTISTTISWSMPITIFDLDYYKRNLCAGQEAIVRTGHGTTHWFQSGKGVCQGCILPPCLFNLYAEYIMRNPRLGEAQAGIKTAGRNISDLSQICRWHHLYGRKRRTKEPLNESERGEWKSWLKTQHSEN